MKERSQDLADSLRDRFAKEPVEFDEDDWYGESFMDTGSVFTDDGFGYSEEDSLPPTPFEHSSEYEFYEDEESESFTYDYHTQEVPSDVTKTRVQEREVAQVELSESWAGQQDDSTFDPNPIRENQTQFLYVRRQFKMMKQLQQLRMDQVQHRVVAHKFIDMKHPWESIRLQMQHPH